MAARYRVADGTYWPFCELRATCQMYMVSVLNIFEHGWVALGNVLVHIYCKCGRVAWLLTMRGGCISLMVTDICAHIYYTVSVLNKDYKCHAVASTA